MRPCCSVLNRVDHHNHVYLGFDLGGVGTCELLLSGSRDQDVAVSLQDVTVIGFGSWEAYNGAVLLQEIETNIRKFPEENHLAMILLSQNK